MFVVGKGSNSLGIGIGENVYEAAIRYSFEVEEDAAGNSSRHVKRRHTKHFRKGIWKSALWTIID